MPSRNGVTLAFIWSHALSPVLTPFSTLLFFLLTVCCLSGSVLLTLFCYVIIGSIANINILIIGAVSLTNAFNPNKPFNLKQGTEVLTS